MTSNWSDYVSLGISRKLPKIATFNFIFFGAADGIGTTFCIDKLKDQVQLHV